MSWPSSAASRNEESLYSPFLTVTFDGYCTVDDGRVMTVTLCVLCARMASRVLDPRLPDAPTRATFLRIPDILTCHLRQTCWCNTAYKGGNWPSCRTLQLAKHRSAGEADLICPPHTRDGAKNGEVARPSRCQVGHWATSRIRPHVVQCRSRTLVCLVSSVKPHVPYLLHVPLPYLRGIFPSID